MNYRIIAYIVGWVLNLQAIFMALPSLTAVIYNEEDISAFLITMVICLAMGLPLTRKKPKNKVFHIKDGCVAVALSWFVLSLTGAIPFVLSGSFPIQLMLFLRQYLVLPPQAPVFLQMWNHFLSPFLSGEVLLTGSAAWEFLFFFFLCCPLQADTT